MKLDPILTKATRAVQKGRYADAIHLLESEAVRYHDSFRYFYILATSCLYAGDFGGAYTYLKRAREIKMRDPYTLIGIAALHLRRGETDRAIELYLEVLELDPRHRLAKKALSVVRKYGAPETLSAWIEEGRLPSLFPPLPKLPSSAGAKILRAAVAGGITLGIAVVLLELFGVPLLPRKSVARSGLEATALESRDRTQAVQTGGAYRYILTQNQVVSTYERARALFIGYRDEAAKVELNRILESNAAEPIKNKARLLLSYAAVPGFDTLKDRFAYVDVLKDPFLYRDVHVIWKGMAANLRGGQNSTDFDLLVGYDTRNALEGIVPVHFNFAMDVNVEQPLEVLGRIVLGTGKDGPGAILRLEGLAVHQAVLSRGNEK